MAPPPSDADLLTVHAEVEQSAGVFAAGGAGALVEAGADELVGAELAGVLGAGVLAGVLGAGVLLGAGGGVELALAVGDGVVALPLPDVVELQAVSTRTPASRPGQSFVTPE